MLPQSPGVETLAVVLTLNDLYGFYLRKVFWGIVVGIRSQTEMAGVLRSEMFFCKRLGSFRAKLQHRYTLQTGFGVVLFSCFVMVSIYFLLQHYAICKSCVDEANCSVKVHWDTMTGEFRCCGRHGTQMGRKKIKCV